MFSNSWFTIWNKYLVSFCVKNKLVSSVNIIKSNMFEAFYKSLTYKRNESGPKIEPYGTRQLIVSKLVFFFFIDLNELSPIWEAAFKPSMISVCYTI